MDYRQSFFMRARITAAGRAHSDDGCDHLSYARARPHTIGSSLFDVACVTRHALALLERRLDCDKWLG